MAHTEPDEGGVEVGLVGVVIAKGRPSVSVSTKASLTARSSAVITLKRAGSSCGGMA